MAGGREFSVPAFERLTPDLTGPERLAVFLGLPVDLQAQAWQQLGERIERHGRARFAEYRLGETCSAEELAAEIAVIWQTECAHVPLAGIAPEPTSMPPAGGQQRPGRSPVTDEDLKQLRSVPSAAYIPRLTGRDVAGEFVQCPLHADGQERTPSLHVSADSGDWYCHGCHHGGGLFEFYAAINGRDVPTGGEFIDFVREIAGVLRGIER